MAAKRTNKRPETETKTGTQAPSDDDVSLFHAAVGKVKPVSNNRKAPEPPRRRPAVNAQARDDRAVMRELLDDFPEGEVLETGEHLAWTAPGLQRSELRKLKSGRYAIQAEVDLHGLNREQAKLELAGFLDHSRKRAIRCVRIIHGRGRKNSEREPVLKKAIDSWLRNPKKILAFCSARDNDGGTGAVYVLLKRQTV